MAGYSGTPLPKKLGIKAGHLLLLDNPPAAWADTWPASHGALPEPVSVFSNSRRRNADIVLAFFVEANRLKRRFDTLKACIKMDGALWVAWPKRASKVPTDVTEDVVRAVALDRGLVDVKVCAIDEVWSGLKLVYRLRDRTP